MSLPLFKPLIACVLGLLLAGVLLWAQHKEVALERSKAAQAASALAQATAALSDLQSRNTAGSGAYIAASERAIKSKETSNAKLSAAVSKPEGKKWADEPIPADVAAALTAGGVCVGDSCPGGIDPAGIPTAAVPTASRSD